MPVLKAKIGGSWVVIGGMPPGEVHLTGHIIIPTAADVLFKTEDGSGYLNLSSAPGKHTNWHSAGQLSIDAAIVDIRDVAGVMYAKFDPAGGGSLKLGASQLPVAVVQGGSYTPGLTAINIGTGGSALNVGYYTYVGGPSVGDRGVLSAGGQITLGTTGASVGGPCEIHLPPGFNTVIAGSSPPMAQINYNNGAAEYQGYAHILNTNSRLQLYYWGVSGTLIARALIGATLPFTWAAGHFMRWSTTLPVVRV